MARGRSSKSHGLAYFGLGLLTMLTVGWLGWRGGWWPVATAPAATSPTAVSTPLAQARRALAWETHVALPEQFEPPVETGGPSQIDPSATASSFPTADRNGWRASAGGSQSSALASADTNPLEDRHLGSPEIDPLDPPAIIAGPRSLADIDRLIRSGDLAAAHRDLSWIYFQQPGQREEIAGRIERTARTIYFSPRPHILPPHTLRPGDSLAALSPRYQVGWQYLAELNGVTPNRIRAGQSLKVIRGPFRVVVDLSEFSLLVRTDTEYVCRFRIGIGRDHSTPIGRFRVLRKVPDPQYTDPSGRVIPARAPDNPLGRHWIDLGEGYGIHGTNQPQSIGRAESRGCVRMRNADVAKLFGMLVTGCEVVIHR